MARQILQGQRLRLVLMERRHLPNRVEFINDPDVQATLNFDFPTSLSRTEAWFARIVLDANRIDFAIETIENSHVIGFGGFVNLDRIIRKGELYIFIGDKTYWGGGFGRDGYKLLVNYGFIELGMERIYGYQLDINEKATQAVTKIGWSVEGLLRKDVWSHGELKSRYVVSILREEWKANKSYDEI